LINSAISFNLFFQLNSKIIYFSINSRFKFVSFKSASKQNEEGNYEEGLAIFSKFPSVSQTSKKFEIYPHDTDKNERIILCNLINIEIGEINFCVTHISYADVVQCRQSSEIFNFVNELEDQSIHNKKRATLLIGDFNTYYDYEYPIDLLTHKTQPNQDKCIPIWRSINFHYEKTKKGIKFEDVWKLLNPNEKGYTFISNTTGIDSCRPDRILYSSNSWLVPKDIFIVDTVIKQFVISDHKALFAIFNTKQ